jgi:hypothetical protein
VFDGSQQKAGVQAARQLHPRLFGGQVDTGLPYTGHLAQRALDPPGAIGAGHATDGQFKGVEGGHGGYP